MLIIEVFLCIFLVLLFYQCCKSGARRARRHIEGGSNSTREDDEERSPQVEADIQRIHTRNNMYERGYRTRRGESTNAATGEARKLLVEKNLFSRRIVRGEKSVRDLKELLAISRGGDDGFDEELGQCCNVDDTSRTVIDPEGVSTIQQTVANDNHEPEIVVTPSIEEAAPRSQETDISYVTSSLPNPSAPPSSFAAAVNDNINVEETSTCVDTIATAISTQPEESAVSVVEPTTIAEQPSSYDKRNTSKPSPQATLEVLEVEASENTQQTRRPSLTLIDPLRNLWCNFITTNPNSSTETPQKPNTNTVTPNGISSSRNTIHYNNVTTHKLECSICLENFGPSDTIAWAKDGGDPPTSFVASAANNNEDAVGCDHIFHKECLVSWLQNSDKCPLCIRKIVHQDAETRFSGWE